MHTTDAHVIFSSYEQYCRSHCFQLRVSKHLTKSIESYASRHQDLANKK